jgi:hypothetical protein
MEKDVKRWCARSTQVFNFSGAQTLLLHPERKICSTETSLEEAMDALFQPLLVILYNPGDYFAICGDLFFLSKGASSG